MTERDHGHGDLVNRLPPSPHFVSADSKELKANNFRSAECKGVMGAFRVSADSEGLTPVWGVRSPVSGVGAGVRTVNLANAGESIIIVSRSQGLFTGALFERSTANYFFQSVRNRKCQSASTSA
jgi:hypothetical protein